MIRQTGSDVTINHMTSFPVKFDNVIFKMASVVLESFCPCQTCNLKEKGFIVNAFSENIGKSNICGETVTKRKNEDFSHTKGYEHPSRLLRTP